MIYNTVFYLGVQVPGALYQDFSDVSAGIRNMEPCTFFRLQIYNISKILFNRNLFNFTI